MAGDLGGELGAGGDVELGEDMDQVGLGLVSPSATRLATARSAGLRLASSSGRVPGW